MASLESWDAISGIVFTGRMTIWQAVRLRDPGFPRQARDGDKDRPFPSARTVAMAIEEQIGVRFG